LFFLEISNYIFFSVANFPQRWNAAGIEVLVPIGFGMAADFFVGRRMLTSACAEALAEEQGSSRTAYKKTAGTKQL